MGRYFNLLFFFLLFLFVSCQNDGYIGNLYGQWRLDSSCVDGVTKENENLYLSFQGQVVMARSVNDKSHSTNDVAGGFIQKDDSLFMVFYQPNSYTTPHHLIEQKFRFEDSGNVRLYILSLSDSKMCLSSGNDKWLFSKY